MSGKILKPKLYNEAPPGCTKLGCGGTVFIPHEDGWQCFNCMKIIYRNNERVTKTRVVKRYSRATN